MATVHPPAIATHPGPDPFRKPSHQLPLSRSNFRLTHVPPPAAPPPNSSSAHAIPIHQTSKPDPFYGHEYIARLCARFITHLASSTHSQATLPFFPPLPPLSSFRLTHIPPPAAPPPNPSFAHAISIHQTSKSDPFESDESIARRRAWVLADLEASVERDFSRSGPYLPFLFHWHVVSGRVVVDSSSSTSTVPPPKCGFRQRHSSSHHNHSPPTTSSTNGTSPTAVAIPNGPPMPMAAVAPGPDAGLSTLGSALSHVYSASAFASHCLTHPTVAHLGVLSALIGLAQAAAVDSSLTPAEHHDHTCTILIPVLISCFLLASLITVWWVRRRTTTTHHSTTYRGTPPHGAPSTSVLFPPPAYLRLNRSAPVLTAPAIINMANSLTATPIQPRQWQWTNPGLLIAGLSAVLTLIGLVLGGLSLLYTRLQVSRA